MRNSRNPLYAPYGAYAMKASYQRNLALANVATATAVGLIVLVGALWPGKEGVEIPPEPIKVAVRFEQLPQHSIVRDQSDWPSSARIKKEHVAYAPPKPVADSELVDEEEMVIASREDWSEYIGRGVDEGEGQGMVIDTTMLEFVPEPTDFVPMEIRPQVVQHYHGDYPRMAEMIGAEGIVHVYVLLDQEGTPLKVRLAKGTGTESLDEAALDWAMRSTYSPGIQNGRPIKVWVVVKYDFKLD